MSKSFDELFDNSCLPKIFPLSKTLSKGECRAIYNYFERKRPSVMFEFGVEYGCSTKAFIEIAKWLDIDLQLHSWDIRDVTKYVLKNEFNFHIEDITGREKVEFDTYNPDLVFLDAHVYYMTNNLMKICIDRKIDFMCHDISFEIGLNVARKRSKNFTDRDAHDAQWELYLLGEHFSKDLFKQDTYENDVYNVRCIRDQFGLSIAEVK